MNKNLKRMHFLAVQKGNHNKMSMPILHVAGTLLVNIVCDIWETQRWKNFSMCLCTFGGQCMGWQEMPLAGEWVKLYYWRSFLNSSFKKSTGKEFISFLGKTANLDTIIHG